MSFCQGNSGDPIFYEDFGTGTNDVQLPPGTTTYAYANGADPNDGFYVVTSNTDYFDWFDVQDVTPNDTNGRMLVVNSDFTAGEFYRTDISGLCENTTYEFSSWLLNLSPLNGFCGSSLIPINVRFEIWDDTDTNLLASGATGAIGGTLTPDWNQYALVFQTLPAQTSVILKMINNGSGGCGNDLAIDDIVFKSCGDLITSEDTSGNNSATICSSLTPFSQSITAIPDNVVFSSHFYQWQSSTDGINWTDLIGETTDVLNINGITTTTFYRAKVAEFASNLTNSDCITFSDVYEVNINQAPAQPAIECWETATFNDTICDWVITGTQPIQPAIECWETATFNNTTCSWEVTGTQPVQPAIECWEMATFNNTTCSWEVTGTQPVQPTIECWETVTFNNTTCSWEVTGTQPAPPNNLECWETATFNNATCVWDVSGTQPVQPTIECWETAIFNNMTCLWEVTGTQPTPPTNLECWETATFNTTICDWEVTGSQPVQPVLECWETATFDNVTCTWEVSGVQPDAPTNLECWEIATFNDITCSWEVSGTEPQEPSDLLCWQSSVFNEDLCEWEILGTQPLEFRDEFVVICENQTIELEAISDIVNPTYQWDGGEDTFSIIIENEGTYEVEVTDGCFTEIIIFNVTEIDLPEIGNVMSDGSSININILNQGDYEYSIDGVNYQFSNIFSGVESGLYTIFVRSNVCNTVVTTDHIHFYIQKFITPNGDGNNDYFNFNVAPYFNSTEVYIFNRFGKLIFSAKNNNVRWDGTFIDNPLPSSDYWYRIVIDNQEFKGHFTLKR
ncbi:T9SS type B sorting domain-containing protein [Winogradskyella sp. A2]|uniref:T9SS type B sorting domain-containing protein n=1 Tax=Winogradskyella sp. A2 TaxID=3366944 RepID=UPI00398C2897